MTLRGLDIDWYQKQKEFRGRLEIVLTVFYAWSKNDSYCQPLFHKALMNLEPVSFEDEGRLDFVYVGKGLRIKRLPNAYQKQYCLLAAVNFTIRQWWGYLNKIVTIKRMNNLCVYLEKIAAKGLDAYEVKGSVSRGYRLKEK